jgi:hypothetical protein
VAAWDWYFVSNFGRTYNPWTAYPGFVRINWRWIRIWLLTKTLQNYHMRASFDGDGRAGCRLVAHWVDGPFGLFYPLCRMGLTP